MTIGVRVPMTHMWYPGMALWKLYISTIERFDISRSFLFEK